MSISSEVQNLQTNLENSYTAVSNKGGTLPQDQCFDNLPNAISTISTGGTINSLNVTPTTSAQTITASGGIDGYSPVNVSAVDASIDSNIQPENIKKDVVILGTTGTLESGEQGEYIVRVFDYDGTILKEEYLDTGDTFTMPSNPIHSGLVFQEWSSPVVITNNQFVVSDYDIIIGAVYTTASGLNEFDIELNKISGLTVTLNMDGTKNWGDGISDTSTTHTYSNYGNYTITCNGTVAQDYALGGSSARTNASLFKGVKLVNISSNTTTSFNTFNCDYFIIANGCFSNKTISFYNYDLNIPSISIPSDITALNNGFYAKNVALPYGLLSIGDSCFQYSNFEYFTIPETVTSIGRSVFNYQNNLKRIKVPNNASIDTSNSASMFFRCKKIKEVKGSFDIVYKTNNYSSSGFGGMELPSLEKLNLTPSQNTKIPGYLLYSSSYSLGYEADITIPDNIETIGTYAFYCFRIKKFVAPSALTTIENYGLCLYTSILKEIDFSNCTQVPTLSGTASLPSSSSLNNDVIIRVSWALYQDFIKATNWSTYIDYIYAGEPATINFSILPVSAEIYIDGTQISGSSTSWIGLNMPYTIVDTDNKIVTADTITVQENETINIIKDLTSGYNKITLATGVNGLNVTFRINGVNITPISESGGNYSIYTLGSGFDIDYSTEQTSQYLDVSGTITTTGSNITKTVTIPQLWVRPDLTANGTIGGNDFAVDFVPDPSWTNYTNYITIADAYKAVDNSTNTYFGPRITYFTSYYGNYFVLYNNTPLLIKEFEITTYRYQFSFRAFQGSNDNTNWTDISFTQSAWTTSGDLRIITYTLTNNNYYKYYRLNYQQNAFTSYANLADIKVIAVEQ